MANQSFLLTEMLFDIINGSKFLDGLHVDQSSVANFAAHLDMHELDRLEFLIEKPGSADP
jgi:hypothetical protein